MTKPQPQPPLRGTDRLAARLRGIRAQGGRSVRNFATDTGIAASKISRVENGQQLPKPEELDAWMRGSGKTGAAATALRAELQELLDGALTERSVNRRRFPGGQAAVQQAITELARGTKAVRTFQTVLVPAMLQTRDYARAGMAETPKLVEGADDVEAGVDARMERAEFVKDTSRRFEFLLWEPVLDYRRGSPEIMRRQFFHLGSQIGHEHIRFGIIPRKTYSRLPDYAAFTLYEDIVVIDHPVGLPRMAGKDAAFLHNYMDLLWEEAVEGDAASDLILAAIDRLAE